MKGKNEIRLSHEAMRAAIEYWLNNKELMKPVTVASISVIHDPVAQPFIIRVDGTS